MSDADKFALSDSISILLHVAQTRKAITSVSQLG
jgi:hypothetical protein